MRQDMPAVHPAADIFPMLPAAELKELAEDIKEHGLRLPIVLSGGRILDGRNRWKACELVGVEPATTVWHGDSPTAYVLSVNSKRRHLGPAQRAAVAAEAVPLFEEEARARMVSGKKHPGSTLPPGGRDQSKRSVSQAAKATGAGTKATQTLKTVKDAAPEVFDLAKEGKVKVAEAKKLASLPAAQRDKSVALVKTGTAVKDAIPKNAIPPVERIAGLAKKVEKNTATLSNSVQALLALLRKHEATIGGPSLAVAKGLILAARSQLDECIEKIGE